MNWDAVVSFFEKWQTLIAGIIAISGAVATISSVRGQIKSNQDIEDLRLDKEAYAARAVLPIALSELTSYAEQCVKAINMAERSQTTQEKLKALQILPVTPKELISSFKDAIRFSGKEKRQDLARLLADFQVQSSRLKDLRRSLDSDRSPGFEYSIFMIDALSLYVLASRHFGWARQDDEPQSGRPKRADLESALHVCQISYHNNQSLLDRLRDWDDDPVA